MGESIWVSQFEIVVTHIERQMLSVFKLISTHILYKKKDQLELKIYKIEHLKHL